MRGQWDALYWPCWQYDRSYSLKTIVRVKNKRLKSWCSNQRGYWPSNLQLHLLKHSYLFLIIFFNFMLNYLTGGWWVIPITQDCAWKKMEHRQSIGTVIRWILFINVKCCFFEWYFWLSVLAFRVLGGLLKLSLRALLYYFYHLLYNCVLIIACSSLAI